MKGARQVLTDSSVDLLKLVEEGIPEREWVPGSVGLLLAGKRHLCAAAAKTGKSITFLAHTYDVVLAGGRVAILDRENGADEYARRLSDILRARDAGPDELARVGSGLRYFAWPELLREHGADADYVKSLGAFDLVIFDSSRAFLTASGVAENDSDEYAAWMAALVDPLARAGIAVLVLDNTGHAEGQRARGTASKADLNEVVIVARVGEEFDRHRTGEVLLTITHSRFAEVERAWRIQLGGGIYGPVQTTAVARPKQDDELTAAVIAVARELGETTKTKIAKGAAEQAHRSKQAALNEVERLIQSGALLRDGDAGPIRPATGSQSVRTGSEPAQGGGGSEVPALKGGEPREPRARTTGPELLEGGELVEALTESFDAQEVTTNAEAA